MSACVLELDQVSYSYPGASDSALVDVSLSVAPGQLVVVAGGSGSGKSTLLRVANGLVPHFHGGTFTGSAQVAGINTREHGPGQLAVAVGSLFQDPETQVVMGTVRAEVALPLENRGQDPSAVARAVEEAALALGVAHLLDRPTGELSGGELQRVALAAALVGRPSLIVLDEPTSQLDPVAGDELLSLLRRLNDDTDATILLAEHRLERCLGFADRVIALSGGSVVCDEEPAEFLRWALESAPELLTPGAKLLGSVGLNPVAGVRAARAALRGAGRLPAAPVLAEGQGARDGVEPGRPARRRGAGRARASALEFDRVWHDISRGPTVLRALSLSIGPGERVALMGRNGAGKSTLLRHAGGLMRPTRGSVRSPGRVALLLQNPTDYLVRDTVAHEAGPAALMLAGLDPDSFAERYPRELSGGEKQRLALAIVLGDPIMDPPAVVCLDEPTRGMDRALKSRLAEILRGLSAAVLVATHDPEFAAEFAERVILLGDGSVIADGPAPEVLAHGTYFVTETARILGGAGHALTPEDGARLLEPRSAEVA